MSIGVAEVLQHRQPAQDGQHQRRRQLRRVGEARPRLRRKKRQPGHEEAQDRAERDGEVVGQQLVRARLVRQPAGHHGQGGQREEHASKLVGADFVHWVVVVRYARVHAVNGSKARHCES